LGGILACVIASVAALVMRSRAGLALGLRGERGVTVSPKWSLTPILLMKLVKGPISTFMVIFICVLVSNLALKTFAEHASQYVSDNEWWLPACVYVSGLVVLLLVLRITRILGLNTLIALGYATIVGAYPALFLQWWKIWIMHFDNAYLPVIWPVGGAVWGTAIHNLFILFFGGQAIDKFWSYVNENYSTNGRRKG
jgi:hypothetical protein